MAVISSAGYVGEHDKNERYCCSMVIWVSCSSLSTLIWSFRIRNQNLKIFFISAVRIFQNLFLIVWPTFSVEKKVLRFQFWAHQSSGRLCFRSIGVLRSIFGFFSKKRKHSELSFLSCSPTYERLGIKFGVTQVHATVTIFEKNQKNDLTPDLAHSWCRPGDWCYFQANLSTFVFVENVSN